MSEVMVRVDENGYLLQQVFHKACLKSEVDLSKYPWIHDRNELYDKARKIEQLKEERRFFTLGKMDQTELGLIGLFQYNPPKEGDKVYEYNDIGALSGSSGYCLIRNGFVDRIHAIWRS